MYDGNSNSGEHAQRDKALLSVGETVILKGVGRAFSHTLRVNEIKPVVFDVTGALRF